MSIGEINQKVAEEICSKLRMNGQAFHHGECVALLDGKVVAITKDLSAAAATLQTMNVNSQRCMVFEVGPLIDIIR